MSVHMRLSESLQFARVAPVSDVSLTMVEASWDACLALRSL